MNLQNKVIGIMFADNIIFKENLMYELISLKEIKKAILLPIIKSDLENNKYIQKITNLKPICYDKGIILEKTIKNLDILILVACSSSFIYRLSSKFYNNNVLRIINICKNNKIPVIIGINFKDFDFSNFSSIDTLYNQNGYYFIPFKINNPITKPNDLTFDSNLIIKTTELAMDGVQIKPIFSFF